MDQLRKNCQVSTTRITTDVTVIKFIGDSIVAGIGGSLHLFSFEANKDAKLERKVEIFDGQKIHGLKFCQRLGKLIVYGGKQFVILDVHQLQKIEGTILLSHWIQAAQWLDKGIAFALSNNSICLWNDGRVAESVLCPIQCIIYSALLLGVTWETLTIFSGTVFSEVLIWGTKAEVWHQLEGHKGVIFSITYDEERQRILTSSDDRSVRVWQKSGEDDWSSCQVNQILELYGHQSRVWRALPAKFGLVSIGEDSVICQWDESGKEIFKVCAHQGGSVWSADLKDSLLVTGGGDGGIMTWKVGEQLEADQCDLSFDVRRVACTKDGCLLVLSEKGQLFKRPAKENFEEVPNVSGQLVHTHKEFVYLLTIDGHLTILKGFSEQVIIVAQRKVSEATVLSLVILNSSTFLISSVDGHRTFWSLTDGKLEIIGSYSVNNKSKGASCGILTNDYFLIGDQDGYLQLVSTKTCLDKMQTLNLKSEGITGLCLHKGLIWASCKEGRLVNLRLVDSQIEIINSGLPRLGMIAGLEVTSEGLLIYSFHKEYFTAWSWDQQRPLFRFQCPGGGHRTWSFKITSADTLTFTYVRHKKAFHFESLLSKIIAPAVRVGLHLRLVNCMIPLDENVLVSGGEDGSLRIYETDSGSPLTVVQAHLSSVRALLRSKSFLVSAGGRAQLIVWNIKKHFDNWILKKLNSHVLLDGDKPFKAPWRDSYLNPRPDPETRYMSLCALSNNEDKLVFLAACSDSLLRVFECSEKSVKVVNTVAHHKNCVLSVSSSDKFDVSGSSDGVIAIWATNNLLSNDAAPQWSGKVHQGGVTSLAITSELCIVSGGDDGIFRVSDFKGDQLKTMFESENATQITGISLFGAFALTTSSGQRLALWQQKSNKWTKKFERISTVSDLQGAAVVESAEFAAKICVYGKGSEVLQLKWE